MFQTSFRDISFYKVENKPRSSKIIYKYLKDSLFGFMGPFYDGKNTPF